MLRALFPLLLLALLGSAAPVGDTVTPHAGPGTYSGHSFTGPEVLELEIRASDAPSEYPGLNAFLVDIVYEGEFVETLTGHADATAMWIGPVWVDDDGIPQIETLLYLEQSAELEDQGHWEYDDCQPTDWGTYEYTPPA